MQFTLSPDLAAIVRPAVTWWSGVRVVDRDARLDDRFAAIEAQVRAHAPEESGLVRTMYKKLGLDPTKTRPSNEALLRRVHKGQPLPRVNSMVDVINWCSLEFQLPYGLYDATQVSGPVALRVGHQGEEYAGIRKDVVHVHGRLALVDDVGPFGNPTSDSARTMVTVATTELLVVIYAPAALARTAVTRVLDTTAARIGEFGGGHERERFACA